MIRIIKYSIDHLLEFSEVAVIFDCLINGTVLDQ